MDRLNKSDKASWQATKNFVASVDFALLREQYTMLAESAKAAKILGNKKQKKSFEGLLNMLGSFQGLAVNHFGVDAVTVFGEEQE